MALCGDLANHYCSEIGNDKRRKPLLKKILKKNHQKFYQPDKLSYLFKGNIFFGIVAANLSTPRQKLQ